MCTNTHFLSWTTRHTFCCSYCITDIWNLRTHLKFPVNAAILEASFTCRDGVEVGGWGIASAHLATHVGDTPTAWNISQLKEFCMGKPLIWLVVSAAAFASCSSAFEAQRQIRHISAIATCHEEQSRLEITQTARVQRPNMKRWHAYQEFWKWFVRERACVCATLRQTVLQRWRIKGGE